MDPCRGGRGDSSGQPRWQQATLHTLPPHGSIDHLSRSPFIEVAFCPQAVPTHGVVAGMSELEGTVMEVVMTFALVYTVYATVADPKKGPFGTADMVNSDHMPLHASSAGFTPNNTYKTAARTIGGKAAPEEHPELPFLNFVCIHSI
ncbi:hypothetical protein C4D60_Mb11t04230 [Musa balbisiana]|uniref:Uncharacterized protein n=1 Tax=Musa balbisiana TaxID=52838 RepID=A0A4S8J1R5_MUSBA|nr:hypothetical protein C4D60_Mb11t04230 [Musa balbisiana]